MFLIIISDLKHKLGHKGVVFGSWLGKHFHVVRGMWEYVLQIS